MKTIVMKMMIVMKMNDSNNDDLDDDDNDDDNNNEEEKEEENEEEENKEEDKNEVKNKEYFKINQINGYFKMIDETKPFGEQINLFKKIQYLDMFWHRSYYDEKELNLKIFKLKFA